MGYQMVNCLGTDFAVDWDVIERLNMSYWHTQYQLQHSEIVETSDRNWNPLSWSLPTMRNVEVEWDKVRQDAHAACIHDMFDYGKRATLEMRDIAIDMSYKVAKTAGNKREFANIMKGVQSDNTSAIDESVGSYQTMVDALRFVRDTSVDIVMIGSTIATGGAAAGLLGAGSTLKGVYKYQDTGSAGAAVLYGGGSLVLGVFKLDGAKLGAAGEAALIVAQGALETGTSLAAGDTFAKAIEKGGLKIASQGTAQLVFSSTVVKNVFDKMPIPFTVFASTKDMPPGMMVDVANSLLEKTGKKLLEKGTKAGIGYMMSGSGTAGPGAGFINEVPLENEILLKLSIVNMKKGIGHGW